jgi:hypothetical protein
MKCANCDNDSHYVYSLAKGHAIHYCSRHVPLFLQKRKQANRLPTTAEWAKDHAEALTLLAPTFGKEKAVSEPTPSVEQVTEQPKEEVKKVRKKAAPKKAE